MAGTSFDQQWLEAKQLHSSADFEVVDHGWEQHVLVDHKNNIVYRYPRNQIAADKLDDEVAVLEELNRMSWPVKIPRILQHTPEYTSYDYIAGEVLTKETAELLRLDQIGAIGRGLGEFFAVLHSAPRSVATGKKTKQNQSLLDYYRQRILHGESSPFFYDAYRDLSDLIEGVEPPEVVVHGDLHGLNMVLAPDSGGLNGVIDFSEVELGDPHQDFRKIFMTDERLVDPATQAYAKTAIKLDKKRIKLWAYVNEWANVCYFHALPENLTYIRAQDHLRKWGKI